MSQFFIGRPIFASVIAIVIMIAGVLAITRLPVSMYPSIAPPTRAPLHPVRAPPTPARSSRSIGESVSFAVLLFQPLRKQLLHRFDLLRRQRALRHQVRLVVLQDAAHRCDRTHYANVWQRPPWIRRQDRPNFLSPDRFHPSGAGYAVWADRVAHAFELAFRPVTS